MRDNSSDYIDFKDDGYCRLYTKKNSDKLILSNMIKHKADQEYIDNEYQKLKLE